MCSFQNFPDLVPASVYGIVTPCKRSNGLFGYFYFFIFYSKYRTQEKETAKCIEGSKLIHRLEKRSTSNIRLKLRPFSTPQRGKTGSTWVGIKKNRLESPFFNRHSLCQLQTLLNSTNWTTPPPPLEHNNF